MAKADTCVGALVYLWDDPDFPVKAFLTKDAFSDGGVPACPCQRASVPRPRSQA
ncbi:MAG TPA: hypothetical protein VFS43_30215 [Polyangiaceae bacterium]|nr:hypothetical protein [Polyangiaceae bacterium]